MIITDCTPFDPHTCTLDASRIDIWQFYLNKPFKESKIILQEDEIKRAERFYFERHRRRFAAARAGIRQIIAAYLHQPAASLEFQYNKHGKPEIIHQQQLEFNLSHSGDIALVAIGQHFPLGIDLEHYSARPYLGIARNLFSLEEQEALKNCPLFARPALFFHIWAQKEAFIKACGLGLAYPTEQFTVSLIANFAEITDKLYHQRWKMETFMPGAAISAAVCYHPSINTIRKGKWNHYQI